MDSHSNSSALPVVVNSNVADTRGPAVLIVTSVMLILSSIFVLLRMISRFGIVRRVAWDDYFILIAWLFASCLSISICYGITVGLGMHEVDVPEAWHAALKRSEYAFSVLYNPSLMATKTSILIFYLSLSKGNKIFRWATYVTLAIANVVGFALTLLNIFQCDPFGAAFQTPTPVGRCQDIITLNLSSAPVNIITDLAILFIPMPMLTSMRLPTKQKTILIITFGIGFFVAVIDVIRIFYLQEASLNRLVGQGTSGAGGGDERNVTDVSWYAARSYMWSAIEVNVGIMCANVPGLKPLVSRFMPAVLRDRDATQATVQMPEKNSLDKPGAYSGHIERSASVVKTTGLAQLRIPSVFGSHSPSRLSRMEDEGVDIIDMMNFLTTPDMAELPQLGRLQQSEFAAAERVNGHYTFHDFVVTKRTKNMVKMTNRESLGPIAMVTFLFFLWGIAYGFLDTLNARFQKIANMSQGKSVGIHSAYFLAYPVATLTFGRAIFKHFGFKACYVAGLCVYACGTLVFWPSAVLTSFSAFLVSNFIVGIGLALLEIAANPFVALCGPPEWMELRLNLSQGIQAVGTVFSPLLASKILFKDRTSIPSLIEVQWAYLGIALFTVLLAVIYYYIPLPETTDEEFEESAEHPDLLNLTEIRGTRLVLITLVIGSVCQFFNVGAQESVSTIFVQNIRHLFSQNGTILNVDSTEFLAIGHGSFAAGRFIAAFLNIFIKPRFLLLGFMIGALVSSVFTMKLINVSAEIGVLLQYFFAGPLFALTYGTALRGLGRFTKDGAALITAAVSGGGVLLPILFGIARGIPSNFQASYYVVVVAYSIALVYPLYLNFFPLARQMVDPVPHKAQPTIGSDHD